MSLTIIFLVIFIALAFEYINGFHDTANSIATVVGTKVLSPRQAIVLATVTNLTGALAGHAVAKTVSSGLVDSQFISPLVIVCALVGGIVWNLLTWWFGLPSSSTHALVGGLCGAAVASAHGKWHAIIWSVEKVKDGKPVAEGVLHKVVVPMVTSPLIGLVGGFLMMGLLYGLLSRARPQFVSRFFGKAQIASAGYMGFAHGLADAQKTMGVITLALVTATASGTFDSMPGYLSFLRMEKSRAAEQAIKDLQDGSPGPAQVESAARTLAGESAHLNPGEFKEAFQALAAVAYRACGRAADAAGMEAASGATHQQMMATYDGRWLGKLPLVGKTIVGAAPPDWRKKLDGEMAAAAKNPGKTPLAAAAGKVRDLSPDVPVWIKVVCALTMAAGTAVGGWRIIKTLGHKLVKLQPVHGFAAETTAATVLAVTGNLGMTVSTTHSITTSIIGVGCAKRLSALRFSLIERIIMAWLLTLPAAGVVGYLMVRILQLCGALP